MSCNPYSDYFLKMLEQEQMLKRHGFDHWPDDEELLYYLCSVDDKLDAVIDRLDLKAEQTRRGWRIEKA